MWTRSHPDQLNAKQPNAKIFVQSNHNRGPQNARGRTAARVPNALMSLLPSPVSEWAIALLWVTWLAFVAVVLGLAFRVRVRV